MYKIIAKIDINVLGTFHSTFLALSHNQLNDYITSTNKVYGKLMNYQSGSAFFTMANKSQHAWSFGSHLLPLI